MTESINGKVLPKIVQGRITGNFVGDRDPSGQTFFLLLDALGRHVELEVAAFRLCEHVARANRDPVIVLVMRRMLEDEERHRDLLRPISSRLGDVHDYAPDTLPCTIGTAIATDEDLASLVQALIDEEGLAGRALRQLAQAEKELVSGFERLWLEMMAADSERHGHLLQVVRQRLQVRARARTTRLAAPATVPLRRR